MTLPRNLWRSKFNSCTVFLKQDVFHNVEYQISINHAIRLSSIGPSFSVGTGQHLSYNPTAIVKVIPYLCGLGLGLQPSQSTDYVDAHS